jgi:hypothetical protein
MSNETSNEPPLWLQGRDAMLAKEENVEWRDGPPDYTLSRQHIHKERTHHFAESSLEAAVESLVQVFELEVSHKRNPAQWLSVVLDKFRTSVNGGPWHDAQDVATKGSYNLFIGETPYYSSAEETFESSSALFRTALPEGFFWEVLEVYSPPPVVAFKWRHWGTFSGPYKGHAPTGEKIELFGMSVARCSDDLKILSVEHFYDNHLFLRQLVSGCPVTGGNGKP